MWHRCLKTVPVVAVESSLVIVIDDVTAESTAVACSNLPTVTFGGFAATTETREFSTLRDRPSSQIYD
jgi:uncharacterized protein YegL